MYVSLLITGFPESMLFTEFSRRFDLLVPATARTSEPLLDERKVRYPLLLPWL